MYHGHHCLLSYYGSFYYRLYLVFTAFLGIFGVWRLSHIGYPNIFGFFPFLGALVNATQRSWRAVKGFAGQK